jgi:small ligand-binding sensory domain FIST
MTLTKTEANRLLEIDGRPALEVWREITGLADGETSDLNHVAAWAIGIERPVTAVDGQTKSAYAIRAAFGFDPTEKSITLQAAIPSNTKIMFHHRTTAAVMEGTKVMGGDLAERVRNQKVWAVLGFECGARTSPFLGSKATTDENIALQGVVAPDAPWLGMLAWGEIAPVGGEPAFHNYTYPLVVLTAA